jgi:hypothetical protein
MDDSITAFFLQSADNPVLNAAQQLGRILAVTAGVGGFLLGAVTMLLLRRRTKPRTERI